MAHEALSCLGHSCGCCMSKICLGPNRRTFMGGAALGLAAATLGMTALQVNGQPVGQMNYQPPAGKKLVVQPVLTVSLFQRQEKTSWRSWGGFHTRQDIDMEIQRIKGELDGIKKSSEFELEFLPLEIVDNVSKAAEIAKGKHDGLLLYAANSWVNVLEALTSPEKWTIVFLRHKSGPVYLWYEIAHNRYLRKTVDQFGQPGVNHRDIVVDNPAEITWRLRALYGLKNTLNKKVVCVGGPAGWGDGGQKAPQLTRDLWKMDLQTVDYKNLGLMIEKARQDKDLVKRCRDEAKKYIQGQGITLETNMEFVENAFVLTEIFKDLLHQAGTDTFTINNCMGTIMGMAQTTACLPLMLLNDAGYQAFCESDFVVIPSGILLHHISSLPVFLNDPTYPHDGMVTLAHCTAPRKMNGRDFEPARILTHFESDYGAAPKVEMKLGQKITVIDPDFDGKQWLGFEGEIVDNPFLDICRSQIDVGINGSVDKLNEETKGFHWMACYGNYLKETGYALNKVGLNWLNLST